MTRKAKTLKNIGQRMSNLLYNYAQSTDIPERYRDQMRAMVTEWDAIRRLKKTKAAKRISKEAADGLIKWLARLQAARRPHGPS